MRRRDPHQKAHDHKPDVNNNGQTSENAINFRTKLGDRARLGQDEPARGLSVQLSALIAGEMEPADASIVLFEHPDILIRDDPDLILRIFRKLLQRSLDPPLVVPTVLVHEWLEGALQALAIKRVREKLLHESCISMRLTSSFSRISRLFDFK